ncbi:MAG: dCTP deaminase [Gammaproteobacteria bacterium]|nr:MAG: dCTP deaminase [Gammaproteobacteria bacterium]
MILGDADILRAIAKEDITLDPEPNWDEQLQPASIDLRLGHSFKVYKLGVGYGRRVIDTRVPDPETGERLVLDDYMNDVELIEGERFILEPDAFALATTLERISLCPKLVGRVEGRSSWGRMGLMIHSTAGFIDPGFEGNITLELSNAGRFPIALYPGDRICQISLHTMSRPAQKPYGVKRNSKYQGQTGVTVSRIHEDLNDQEVQGTDGEAG